MRDQAIIHIRELIDRADVRNHQNNWNIALKGEFSGLITLAQNDETRLKAGSVKVTLIVQLNWLRGHSTHGVVFMSDNDTDHYEINESYKLQ